MLKASSNMAPVTIALALSAYSIDSTSAQEYYRHQATHDTNWRAADHYNSDLSRLESPNNWASYQPDYDRSYQNREIESINEPSNAHNQDTDTNVTSKELKDAVATIFRAVDNIVNGCNRYLLIGGSIIGTLISRRLLIGWARGVVEEIKNDANFGDTTTIEHRLK